ncbi:hypothetical protein EFL95_10870 [Nocardioides marmorisolisilvae]|uniref:DUF3558 domain-containing protein n=1 Tax=Nocardioides marmorisolisilvae TaxID=1542737 RepID=A0A3N0DV55_9ACTN|nr:hypothetical protein EFL95_10870 [Nocardioides marmorisolisilvae]
MDTSIDPCLISKAALNDVLAGGWSAGNKNSSTVCFYRSGRGGIFAITNVEEPDPQRGLEDARAACDSTPRRIASTQSFACLEHADQGDVISGNLIWKNQVWLVTIVAGPGGGAHTPELNAMTAILKAIPAD